MEEQCLSHDNWPVLSPGREKLVKAKQNKIENLKTYWCLWIARSEAIAISI